MHRQERAGGAGADMSVDEGPDHPQKRLVENVQVAAF